MPLRPALVAFHPRGPEPRAVRPVTCPHCGSGFEISRRAISIRCPSCTRPLQFSDLHLRHRVEGDVATMGCVDLESEGEMNGRLICGQLTSAGSFEGSALVYGPVVLHEQSLTTGQLTCKSLDVPMGATLRCRIHVCPKPRVSPTLQRLATRPLRPPGSRLPGLRQTTFEPVR